MNNPVISNTPLQGEAPDGEFKVGGSFGDKAKDILAGAGSVMDKISGFKLPKVESENKVTFDYFKITGLIFLVFILYKFVVKNENT